MVSRHRRQLIGLVTLKRLKSVIQNNGSFPEEAFEPDPPTTNPDAILEDLFPIAAEADYPIAVVDEEGKFMGEIQISSIFENMIQDKEVVADE